MNEVKKKIKITHISRYAFPHIGGIEAVISQINESLPNEDFEKEVLCCSNTEKSAIENDTKYTRCRYLFDFAANSISPQLFFKMMFLKTDIIHFHMPVIQNVIIWFILYHLGLLKYKKMIVTYHGAIVGYDKYMKPFWGLYRYFFKKADLIHVLSPNVINSDKILQMNKEKCVVIPYGVDIPKDTDYLEKEILDFKSSFNNQKIILCLGRLARMKGIINVIKAMEFVNNALLLIVGDGPLKKDFETYISINKLNTKVKLFGSIADLHKKAILINSSEILVLASESKSESFGIVLLEAMKFAKPVINTNLGTGVNYVSIDGETGLTVEPANVKQLAEAINKLINDDELLFKYGQNAKKRVQKIFDLEKIKKKYIQLYTKI